MGILRSSDKVLTDPRNFCAYADLQYNTWEKIDILRKRMDQLRAEDSGRLRHFISSPHNFLNGFEAMTAELVTSEEQLAARDHLIEGYTKLLRGGFTADAIFLLQAQRDYFAHLQAPDGLAWKPVLEMLEMPEASTESMQRIFCHFASFHPSERYSYERSVKELLHYIAALLHQAHSGDVQELRRIVPAFRILCYMNKYETRARTNFDCPDEYNDMTCFYCDDTTSKIMRLGKSDPRRTEPLFDECKFSTPGNLMKVIRASIHF